MSDPRRDFRSDNVGGVAPELLEAIVEAGRGTASPYGNDAYPARMVQRLSALFEREVAAFPVTTGTGANAQILIGAAGTMKYQYWRIQKEQG